MRAAFPVPSKPILFMMGLVLAAALVVILWKPWAEDPFQVKQRQVTAVTTHLKEVFPLSTVQTAEALYNFVFPFDFFSDEGPWVQVLGRPWSQIEKTADPELTNDERDLKRLYQLGLSLGLTPHGGKKFIVVPVLVRAGINLRDHPVKTSWGDPGPALVVTLPPVQETDFMILKEEKGDAGGFPEYPLTADQWKRLAQAMEPAIRLILKHRGLYQEAQDNAQKMFSELLITAGLGPCRVKVGGQED